MSIKLRPAEVVLHEFGGVCATARALGRHKSTISKWTKSKEDQGTGGLVPSGLQRQVLEIAKERGLYLTAEELIFGREYTDE